MHKIPTKLNASYYQSTDVVGLARGLIGKILVSNTNNEYTAGIIVETEAYRGPDDQACHAYNYRRTARTEVMYHAGGIAYIYLCYGIHHLFNVVTGPKEYAHAILIRALEPLEGIEYMMARRQMNRMEYKITKGPGALSMAMGFNISMSGSSLTDQLFYIEDRGIRYPADQIVSGKRIGVGRAGASAGLPWRFYVRQHHYVSASRS